MLWPKASPLAVWRGRGSGGEVEIFAIQNHASALFVWAQFSRAPIAQALFAWSGRDFKQPYATNNDNCSKKKRKYFSTRLKQVVWY